MFLSRSKPSLASRTAVVRVPPASEPASGSVSDQAPSFLPWARGMRYLRLFFSAELVNVIGAQRIVSCDNEADGTIDPGQFFDDSRVLDVTQPRAAEFLRENHAHQAHFGEFGKISGEMRASSHSMTWGAISASANSRTLAQEIVLVGKGKSKVPRLKGRRIPAQILP